MQVKVTIVIEIWFCSTVDCQQTFPKIWPSLSLWPLPRWSPGPGFWAKACDSRTVLHSRDSFSSFRGENLTLWEEFFLLNDNDQHFGWTGGGGPLSSYFGDQRILYFGDRKIIRWGLRTHPPNGYALRLLGGQQYFAWESSNLSPTFLIVIIILHQRICLTLKLREKTWICRV